MINILQKLADVRSQIRENAQKKARSERTTSNYGISRMFHIRYVPAGSEERVASTEPLAGDLGEMRQSYFTEAEDEQNPFKKRRSSIFGNAGDSLFGN